ncbi:hypothetical protein [Helicobacter suis]|uniref:hypothetical protein n=1 Tax=Helicobacter suis TaxID=104628 RepID=UPI0013D7267C|nr:hypothetical protein [Helicobacter suis]
MFNPTISAVLRGGGGGGGSTHSRSELKTLLKTLKKEALKKHWRSINPAGGGYSRPSAEVSEKHRQSLADTAYFCLLAGKSADSQEYPLKLDLDPSLFHDILDIYIEILEDFEALFEELISLSHDLLDLPDIEI